MAKNPTENTRFTKSTRTVYFSRAAKKQNVEDNRKLLAAIMSAISSYIQMEQQTPSVVPDIQPQPKVGQRKNFSKSQ